MVRDCIMYVQATHGNYELRTAGMTVTVKHTMKMHHTSELARDIHKMKYQCYILC